MNAPKKISLSASSVCDSVQGRTVVVLSIPNERLASPHQRVDSATLGGRIVNVAELAFKTGEAVTDE
jgi:hypothetical protein